jgi:hypothetical protein
MAITGNNTLSIRKKDLANQKSIAVGFKRTVFAHKASAGETGISVGNLVTPTELSGMGFTQPTFSEIASGQMKAFRNNVKIVSSSKGLLMDFLSYNIKSATEIEWVGFTADQDEIFVVEIDHNARTGVRMVDAAPLVATGVLAAGSQDFSVGMPFAINKYPSMQVGAVTVYEDGVQVYRNTGNATAAPSADGNYQEVDAGNGYGSLIRFNTTEAYDRNITVISTGLLVEKPNDSQLAEIEAVQGQVDRLVETVAALAGVPETDFQAAPSQIQLKQFGDRVLAMEQNRARIDQSNVWTFPQPLVGVTNGSAAAAGEVGQVINQPITSNPVTVTADTYIDATGNLVLPPGCWMVGYTCGGGITKTAAFASTGINGEVCMRDVADNSVLADSRAYLEAQSTSSTLMGHYTILSKTFFLNTTTTRTFKMSARCGQAAANGFVQILGTADITGGLSGNDNSSLLWAVRIR